MNVRRLVMVFATICLAATGGANGVTLAARYHLTSVRGNRYPLAGWLRFDRSEDVAKEAKLAANAGVGCFLYAVEDREDFTRVENALERGLLATQETAAILFAFEFNASILIGEDSKNLGFAELLNRYCRHRRYLHEDGRCFVALSSVDKVMRTKGRSEVVRIVTDIRKAIKDKKGVRLCALTESACGEESYRELGFDCACHPLVAGEDPNRFENMLREEIGLCEGARKGVVIVDSWNDHPRDRILLPDSRRGDGMLRAVAGVMGRFPSSEYWFVDAATKCLFGVPKADHENVPYDIRDPKQRIDVWLPKNCGSRTPVVIYYHGGSWTSGCIVDRIVGNAVQMMLEKGCAVVAVGYRYLPDVHDAWPPVFGALNDCEAALRYVYDRAEMWNLDCNRVALMGGSAGAASALYLGLKENNRYGVTAIGAIMPQTSLDPKEMKAWIPNINYGAYAFGFKNFDAWLAGREKSLGAIERVSASRLIYKVDVDRVPQLEISLSQRPKLGTLPTDPTHAGEFGVNFAQICKSRGLDCHVGYESSKYFISAFQRVSDILLSR